MSSKLSSLVQASDDPQVLLYVVNNLGRGVPQQACFASTVQTLRRDAASTLLSTTKRLLLRKQRETIEDQLMPVVLQMQERQLTSQLFQRASLSLSIAKIVEEKKTDTLQKQLKNEDPLVRLLTVSTVGRRHLHLEADLIERLTDPHPTIREAAHAALIRVSRGTDFGPIPGASQSGIRRSIEKWQQWLALQKGESPEAIAQAGTPTMAKPDTLDPDKAFQVVLGHGNRELQTASPEVTQLCNELVKARGDEQMSILARLRDSKGIDNTDALALAIPKLPVGAAQREARDALAQRLTRMTAATLHDKLQEDAVEVRRAAALACGRKKATEYIPDLLQLLDDPEVAVIQAARTALKELTGEDFGPDEEAGRRGRASAAAAWRKWWKEHPSEQQ